MTVKLTDLKPTVLSQSITQVFKASDRLAVQTQASISDFTANHEERFKEAGTAGGTLLIVSALAKDAVNTLKISEDLTDQESVQIHNAVGQVMQGLSVSDATDSLTPKQSLLVQAFLLAYQMGELPEAKHSLPASFNAVVNPDNSVTTSDKQADPEDDE